MHRILIIIELYWNQPIVATSTSFCIFDSNIAKMRNAQELPSIRLIVNISAHFTLTYPSKFCTLWVLNTFDSTSCSCHKGHFLPICDFKVFATCCMQHQENSRALSLKLQVAIICAHNYGISCTRTIKNILSSSPWKPHKSCTVSHSRANAKKNSKVMNALQAAERALTTLLSLSLSLLPSTRVCACVCACVWIGGVFVVMFFTCFQLLALVFCALPFFAAFKCYWMILWKLIWSTPLGGGKCSCRRFTGALQVPTGNWEVASNHCAVLDYYSPETDAPQDSPNLARSPRRLRLVTMRMPHRKPVRFWWVDSAVMLPFPFLFPIPVPLQLPFPQLD